MEVKLTYFKENGKYYTEGTYVTQKKEIFEIHDEVRKMKAKKSLPGITGNEFTVHVDIPVHPDNHPRLI